VETFPNWAEIVGATRKVKTFNTGDTEVYRVNLSVRKRKVFIHSRAGPSAGGSGPGDVEGFRRR
jgi:hypothetical protein